MKIHSPNVNLTLSDIAGKEGLAFVGLDIAVLEEIEQARETSPKAIEYKAKDGKVKRVLTNATHIDLHLGDDSQYKKGIKHKLAVRMLYKTLGSENPDVLMFSPEGALNQWGEIKGSDFIVSFFTDTTQGKNFTAHTDQWDNNRNIYNKIKNMDNNVTVFDKTRPDNTYWSGEKILINLETRQGVSEKLQLEVSLLDDRNHTGNTSYQTVILTNPTKVTKSQENFEKSTLLFAGEIWDRGMINRWGNHTPEILTLRVVPIVEGKRFEEDSLSCEIIMDNRDPFFRIHQMR